MTKILLLTVFLLWQCVSTAFKPVSVLRHRSAVRSNIHLLSMSETEETSVPGDKLKYGVYEAAKKDSIMGENEFCLIDSDTGKPILLTREEKERIFLDSIQSFYFSGKSNLPDEDFDRLREDLSWEGSALVTLNRNETRFLNAVVAYNKGSPILSDSEFDTLKINLRETGSKIAVATEPKYYVDTGVCKVTNSSNLRNRG